MELYQITYNSDSNAGAGRTVFQNLYFESFISAQTFIKSKYYADCYGVQGCIGNTRNIRTVKSEDIEPKIYSNITDYQEKTGVDINLTNKQNKEKKLENMTKEDLIKSIKSNNIY